MSITRRKLFGLLPAISAFFVPALKAEAKPDSSPRSVFGYDLHDDVSISLLKSYARSLALNDEKVRREAQMMFHEAQLTREGGGTLPQILGARHKDFVEAHENDRLVDHSHPRWQKTYKTFRRRSIHQDG